MLVALSHAIALHANGHKLVCNILSAESMLSMTCSHKLYMQGFLDAACSGVEASSAAHCGKGLQRRLASQASSI